MTKVSMSTDLGVSADKVWTLIGGFNSLPDWDPDVEKSVLENGGRVRRLSIKGGGTILERLESIDDEARACTYTILDGPLPVRNYRATLKVIGKGKACKVEWSSEFDPVGNEADASAVIRGVYEAGLSSLRRIFAA